MDKKNLSEIQETQEMWVWSLGQEGPLEEEWQATPVLLPGESHGRRSLLGYGPQSHKESDTTEQQTLSLFIVKVKVIV